MEFHDTMKPRGFLSCGGLVLVLLGILGFVGITGPTPGQSMFGTFWWFDNYENVAHTVLGVVALLAAYRIKDEEMIRNLVLLVGALAFLAGLYNFSSDTLLGAQLQVPADMTLHLVVGVWGLAAGLMARPGKVKAKAKRK
jgi:hypothetical protein